MDFDDIVDGITSIPEVIGDFFRDLVNPEFWGNSEVFTSYKFWIPILLAGGALYWVLGQWQGKVPGLAGYYIIGGVATLLFGYFWAARDLDKNG